ncbi:unnamed protein product [Blepharisma stoltei]|uniref:Uncharacterized protein n=1 Tax=Blepharisma stoltei TaxID=1481888 RepID=A0AAU9JPZ9_9CILI|nr:unnamed protein product [Blepharisma stoltei]
MGLRFKKIHLLSLLTSSTLLLIIGEWALLIVGIMSPDWTRFSVMDQKFNYGLFDCEDCPSEYAHTNYSCLSELTCDDSQKSSLCEKAVVLSKSRLVLLVFLALGSFVSLLLFERLFYMVLKRPYGGIRIFYAFSVLPAGIQIVGIMVYIFVSGVSVSSTCNEKNEICSGNGLWLVIESNAVAWICVVTSIIILRSRDKGRDKIIREPLNFGNYGSWFSWKVLPILLLGICFIGIGYGWKWVSYHSRSKIYGNLVGMNQYEGHDELDYMCISGPRCEETPKYANSIRNCNAFHKLGIANYYYLWFTCISYILLIMWIEHLIFLARKINFGIVSLNYFWPILTTVINLCGNMSWFIVSGASYSSTCKIQAGDTDISFCAEQGPTFSLIGVLCFCLSSFLYIAIFSRRTIPVPLIKSEPQLKRTKSRKVLDEFVTINKTIDELDNSASESYEVDNINGTRPCTQETLANEEPIKMSMTFRNVNFRVEKSIV